MSVSLQYKKRLRINYIRDLYPYLFYLIMVEKLLEISRALTNPVRKSKERSSVQFFLLIHMDLYTRIISRHSSKCSLLKNYEMQL